MKGPSHIKATKKHDSKALLKFFPKYSPRIIPNNLEKSNAIKANIE